VAFWTSLSRPITLPQNIDAPTALWVGVTLWHISQLTWLSRFSERRRAAEYNLAQLAKIQSQLYIYEAYDYGLLPPATIKAKLHDCIAPSVIQLRVGAQVMLTAKISNLPTGTMGRIIDILPREGGMVLPTARFHTQNGFIDLDIYSCRFDVVRSEQDGSVLTGRYQVGPTTLYIYTLTNLI